MEALRLRRLGQRGDLAGSVDIGLAGSSPASRGLSSGIEYQVPWIHDVIGEAEALCASGSGIASIEDLAGKTIATPFASTAHYSLLAALEAPACRAATSTSSTPSPTTSTPPGAGRHRRRLRVEPEPGQLIAEGGTVLITSAELAEQGKTTYDLAVVTNEFAEEYPDAVQIVGRAAGPAVELIQDDPDAAAEAVAAELNITPRRPPTSSDLVFVGAADQVGADYLGGGLAANLFAAAEFNQ